eukprot:TRINITY_DN686_c1_g1_i5.p4 TRINITY_DN686_c1_g1~~TRINITY_DN686_c1_g1_i5.p4  ORF type:complete len:112 (-),score=28.32 TRINITY_DN686_c1_g1_i5:668-1003(-)
MEKVRTGRQLWIRSGNQGWKSGLEIRGGNVNHCSMDIAETFSSPSSVVIVAEDDDVSSSSSSSWPSLLLLPSSFSSVCSCCSFSFSFSSSFCCSSNPSSFSIGKNLPINLE